MKQVRNWPAIPLGFLLAAVVALHFACCDGWANGAAQMEAGDDRFVDVLRLSPSPPAVWAEATAKPDYGKPPLTVECWARLKGRTGYNILAANEPKESATHWELYSFIGSGKLSAYLPGCLPAVISTERDIVDEKWHCLAMTFDGVRVRLYVDGKEEANVQVVRRDNLQSVVGGLAVGKAAAQLDPNNDTHGCDGEVAELRLSKTARVITQVPRAPWSADAETVGLWRFGGASRQHEVPDAARPGNPMRVVRIARKSLDELDRESFKASAAPMDSPAKEVAVREGRAEHPAGVTMFSLDGAWQMAEGGEPATRLSDKWMDSIPAEVPGSVHSALQKAGKIPDPKVGLNDAIARTNSFKTWWFKRTFERPAGLTGGRLVFGGVAVKCTVWLNGRELGSHEGMFGGPEFDVAGLLQDQNTLIVRIFPAPYVEGKGQPNDFFRGMNVGWLYTVVFNNVYGWHYSNIPALGIWRSVRLEAMPKVRLNSPFVATRDAQGGIVDLSCDLEGPNQGWSGRVMGTIEPDNFSGKTHQWSRPVTSAEATQSLHIRFTVPEPHLWWPNDIGEHNLYRLKLSFLPDGGGDEDTRTLTFGLRTIEMAPLPGGPNPRLCNWTFVINKRPQFVKGANWCTMDSSMDFSRSRYERFINLAALQHIQMFRAWGSGMPETDEFYDLCNRHGIMVMQEWPTAWDSHKEGWQPYNLLEETVRLNMLRLRNNPSLVLWGGGNESGQPYGKAIDMMGRYSIELDGSRPFHRGEAYGGSTHNYDCDWAQRPLDVALGLTAPFFGEFGMRSMPVYESVQRYLPENEKNLWPAPDGLSFAYHTPVFNQKGDMAMLRKFAGYFSEGRTMAGFCVASQVAATTCVRHTLERARTRWPDCAGSLYYKMNDNYPAASWSCVDWYGAPKLNHYFFTEAFAPLHACALLSTFNPAGQPASLPVFLLDDAEAFQTNSWQVAVRAFDASLKLIKAESYPGQGAIARVAKLGEFSLTAEQTRSTPLMLVVELRKNGVLADRTFYWLNYEAVKDCLFKLPKTKATLRIAGRTAVVTNQGAVPAVGVNLSQPGHADTFVAEESFFWLEPGESKTVGVNTAEGLQLLGWNL